MTIALSTKLHSSFDDAVQRTREALAQQGFGVLTEIDMKATLKAKLGEDLENYMRRQIMYARSTAIQAQPSSIDVGIAHVRDTVFSRFVTGLPRCSVAAQTSRNGRPLSCTVTTAPTRARASEPPGSRSVRIKSTEASMSTSRLSCPHSRSSRDFAVRACWSTGRPVGPCLRRHTTASPRWKGTETGWTRSGLHGHRASRRRGARRARLRVGVRPPTCARDGLTAGQARSGSRYCSDDKSGEALCLTGFRGS